MTEAGGPLMGWPTPINVTDAIDLAEAIVSLTEWPTRFARGSNGALHLEARKGRSLTLVPSSADRSLPIWHATTTELPSTAGLGDPGQIAVMDALTHLGSTSCSAMVIAPASPGRGPIDSVAYGGRSRCRSSGDVSWTAETLQVPQSRSWLTRIDVPATFEKHANGSMAAPRIWRTPNWLPVADTAAMTDLLERHGPVGGSPWTVLISEGFDARTDLSRTTWWLTSWLGVAASVLDAAYRLTQPYLHPDCARRFIDSSFRHLGFGP